MGNYCAGSQESHELDCEKDDPLIMSFATEKEEDKEFVSAVKL